MFFMAALAQFFHIAQNDHLVRHFHPTKILQCRHHAGRIGIVGIHNQIIVGCRGELRTVVVWNIFFQCFRNQFFRYMEETSDSDGGKGIFKIVRAYQMSAYRVLSALMFPLESEEWGTCPRPATDVEFRFVFCAIGDTGQSL